MLGLLQLTSRLPIGSRFLVSAVGSFLVTVAILASAGYAISEMSVRQPGDPFRAGSFEFDLAPGWWCEREKTEYVCNPSGRPPYSAIAIVAIKDRNESDNLKTYEDHLSQPRLVGDGASNKKMSVVSFVKRVKLGHAEWVEALHLGSEVLNYDTYYLATNTSHLGILVTMSVHRDYETIYAGQLTDMMRTLNLYQR
jgi:hypothetical protein